MSKILFSKPKLFGNQKVKSSSEKSFLEQYQSICTKPKIGLGPNLFWTNTSTNDLKAKVHKNVKDCNCDFQNDLTPLWSACLGRQRLQKEVKSQQKLSSWRLKLLCYAATTIVLHLSWATYYRLIFMRVIQIVCLHHELSNHCSIAP